jgi:nicotinate-nucleotide adenylyltransferase
LAQSHLRSIGILGGTFNPPHLAHLALAAAARAELELERVFLMPVHTPLHKPIADDPGPEHRLRMCRALVEGAHGLAACALEVERAGRSYTVETLEAIHASDPQAELTLVMGADTAATLAGWREPRRLLELARLAVAARDGAGPEQTLAAIARVQPQSAEQRAAGARVSFLALAPIVISSSLIRRRTAEGEPIEDLVGKGVAGYIAEHRLYRAPVKAPS